jgi:quinol-cytochrome oxidoreductase complex cytochrome b subunit
MAAEQRVLQEPGEAGSTALPIFSFIDHSLESQYPTPRNLQLLVEFRRARRMVMLVVMIALRHLPGDALHAAHDYAFDSVERIMRDVNFGWLLRYVHMNGASMFFIVVYIHIFRGLYYGSYKAPRELLWMLGVVICC